MFKINDYVVYKKEVCKIIDIRKNHMNNMDYYILIPVFDESLKIDVPTNNRCGFLRELLSKEEVLKFIKNIPNIKKIETNDRMIENEYKILLQNGTHEDLIKIIKTTYLRNKNRLDQNKKISETDDKYFKLAEKYLYSEFSIILNMSLEETKEFIVNKLSRM